MVTTRTTKNKIKSGLIEEKLLRLYTHRAKNLYNAGLYLVRQAFFKNEKYPGYRKIYEDLKGSQDFALMHANTGQQVLRKVDADMKSFFKNMGAAAAEAATHFYLCDVEANLEAVLSWRRKGRACKYFFQVTLDPRFQETLWGTISKRRTISRNQT